MRSGIGELAQFVQNNVNAVYLPTYQRVSCWHVNENGTVAERLAYAPFGANPLAGGAIRVAIAKRRRKAVEATPSRGYASSYPRPPKGHSGKFSERNTKMGDQETLDEFVAKKAEDGRLTILERSAIRRQTRKLTDVNVNLAYARMAVSFVKQKVPLVANWDEPLPTSFESIIEGMDTAKSRAEADRVLAKAKAARDKADKCVYDNLRPD